MVGSTNIVSVKYITPCIIYFRNVFRSNYHGPDFLLNSQIFRLFLLQVPLLIRGDCYKIVCKCDSGCMHYIFFSLIIDNGYDKKRNGTGSLGQMG